jgi:hypothetical protein
MASGTKSKGAKPKTKSGSRSGRRSTVATASRPKPWGTIAAVVAVVLLAVGVIGYSLMTVADKEMWIVSDDNQDPSDNIDGVFKGEYKGLQHVTPEQRVDYDRNPPVGGPHDGAWADCQGTVYPNAVRTENMVHSLEHGAVWIAYDPDKVKGAALETLRGKVEGQPYMMMSPYPGLDQPISLQSWGHQLKLSNANDERIDQFIRSLRDNRFQNPEPGGRCDAQPGAFDVANPPPFDPAPPPADAVPMSGEGSTDAAEEEQGGQPPVPPATDGTAPPTQPAPPAGTPPPTQ